ncbi:MAG: ClpXP protease specificity-enhancing factor SspB [Myxococcales bacterium]|nr:ClpXP protease specificity-enhancing factor SspB [Myxococcales bacterium]
MGDANRLPNKRDVAQTLLLKGGVFLHLDPRRPEVRVPEWLKAQPQVVLQIGLDMLVPIPDLRVDEAGVFGTLSFNRTPFTCLVPWDAVFAVVGDDGRGMVWPASMPPEIAAEVEREAQRAKAREAGTGGSSGPHDASRSSRKAYGLVGDEERDDAPAARPFASDEMDRTVERPSYGASSGSRRPSSPPKLEVVRSPEHEGHGGKPAVRAGAQEATDREATDQEASKEYANEAAPKQTPPPSRPGSAPPAARPPYLRLVK